MKALPIANFRLQARKERATQIGNRQLEMIKERVMNARTGFSVATFIVIALMSVSVAAQEIKPLAPFTSVELQGGGKVFISTGASQRVTLRKGNSTYTKVRMADRDRLVVENCQMRCPRGYQMEIEIIIPGLAGISVANGGLTQSRGHFPPQAAIGVAVTSGGTIDIRSMTINSVTAAVSEGGRIFVKPQTAMVASVFEGGAITYWGDAQVTSSIQRGGVVTRGSADEADKPVSDLDDSVPALPAVPPVPPVQRVRNPRR